MNATASSNTPNVGGSIEDWLEGQVARHAAFFRERPLLLDVGAYHGDFARRFVGAPDGPFRDAILLEPNPENFRWLEQTFSADKRFRLEAKACLDSPGAAKLYCQGPTYTGSLLPYQEERPGPKAEHAVNVTSVDELLAGKIDLTARAGIIKIDTQGNDLRVLQGAARTLRCSRPWVITEMLATPRFVNQATPLEVMGFMAGQNYFLAAQFNEYYTATGWLAWYDACFVPQELFSMDVTANIQRPAAADARAGAAGKGAWRRKLGRILTAG